MEKGRKGSLAEYGKIVKPYEKNNNTASFLNRFNLQRKKNKM